MSIRDKKSSKSILLAGCLIACCLMACCGLLGTSLRGHSDTTHQASNPSNLFGISCAYASDFNHNTGSIQAAIHAVEHSMNDTGITSGISAPPNTKISASSSTAFYLKTHENPFNTMNTAAYSSVLLTEGDTYTLQSAITYDDRHKDYVSHEWVLSENKGSDWENLNTNAREYTIENAQKGDYLYKMTAQDVIGNSATETFQVTVQQKPSTALANTAEATDSSATSSGSSVSNTQEASASKKIVDDETPLAEVAESILAKTADSALPIGIGALVAALGAALFLTHSSKYSINQATHQRRLTILKRSLASTPDSHNADTTFPACSKTLSRTQEE